MSEVYRLFVVTVRYHFGFEALVRNWGRASKSKMADGAKKTGISLFFSLVFYWIFNRKIPVVSCSKLKEGLLRPWVPLKGLHEPALLQKSLQKVHLDSGSTTVLLATALTSFSIMALKSHRSFLETTGTSRSIMYCLDSVVVWSLARFLGRYWYQFSYPLKLRIVTRRRWE